MNAVVEYLSNKASDAEIAEHLTYCNSDFVPPLSARVDIGDYAKKIAGQATTFEAWSEGTLVGLVAGYCNDRKKRIAHVTNVSVLKTWTGRGIAAKLMSKFVAYAKELGLKQVRLEVAKGNSPAIKLYRRFGFVADNSNSSSVDMNLYL